uniref:RRM domain-containing protein n=1 Tax=Oryza barthii TaxID=65489 RepID=A0A0D3F7A6_9ORYZ
MARKRNRGRTRRATQAEAEVEQSEREMVGDEAVEEEDDDVTKMNPPPATAGEREEEEEEGIEGLLEPFTRNELLDLLVEACLRNPALRSRLAATAESDAAHRRLFVHGLGPGFRGYAIFFYKYPEGLTKALEERKVVFDGCELHCRRAHRVNKEKHLMTMPADAGAQSNGFENAASPIIHVQPKELALASTTQTPLGSNRPVEMMAKGPRSGTVPFRQNAGAGLLGACPVATVTPSTPDQSTPVSHSGASISTPRTAQRLAKSGLIQS